MAAEDDALVSHSTVITYRASSVTWLFPPYRWSTKGLIHLLCNNAKGAVLQLELLCVQVQLPIQSFLGRISRVANETNSACLRQLPGSATEQDKLQVLAPGFPCFLLGSVMR